MSNPPTGVNVLFRMTAALAAVFVVTILALVMAMIGEPSPVANFLNDHGGAIVAVEVAATLLCALAAMTADRRQTLKEQRSEETAGTRDETEGADDSDRAAE